MGAERYLASVLFKNKQGRYNIKADIIGKDILVIPGYGNSSFLFAQRGAKSITVYDKDPVTIAWVKAFKKYYHYRENAKSTTQRYPSIGELLTALTKWYPPLLLLPLKKYQNSLFWAIHPNLLRRNYIHYMVSLVQQAIRSKDPGSYELDKNIQFHVGTLENVLVEEKPVFDTVFIPYLLGIQNGIEEETDIIHFMEQLLKFVPKAHILVNPSRHTKEFYITGKQYFVTTGHSTIQTIPGLETFFIQEDAYWFRTQGLAVFGSNKA